MDEQEEAEDSDLVLIAEEAIEGYPKLFSMTGIGISARDIFAKVNEIKEQTECIEAVTLGLSKDATVHPKIAGTQFNSLLDKGASHNHIIAWVKISIINTSFFFLLYCNFILWKHPQSIWNRNISIQSRRSSFSV